MECQEGGFGSNAKQRSEYWGRSKDNEMYCKTAGDTKKQFYHVIMDEIMQWRV